MLAATYATGRVNAEDGTGRCGGSPESGDESVESALRRLLEYRPTATELLQHESNMRVAIEAARMNPEFPFGAAIFDRADNYPIAIGVGNQSIDPISHSELVAINNMAAQEGEGKWSGTTLYATGEPCCMCMGAIIWIGIPRIVWGSSIAKIRNFGIGQIDIGAAEVAARSHEIYTPEYCVSGVLSDETDELFRIRR
ncbi:nucleoside deaminase [Mycobacterium attenuatum]|uniref:nucleoside deaminase n=1 Tax=Mycobacterium attenuatum TaxID=2341086 RepID=UPI000F259231|nr:nucleoside deaminase [Mycobacterium attenuatum]VBA57071.1 tRNA-specific adenosine deaminase [Mycobacterium attenuatum]VBA60384.1 tRNA-specific adenosine deaminase [Mycobacterium attenuatum]